ncbi:PQQ-binding-like beta-propeller repeat protein, partial [bacterium]|nr:PQQ-binding-like beta-propeller repeat protein [bacterium]
AAFMLLGRPSPEYFNLQGGKRYAKEFFQTLAMPCAVGIVLIAGALWRPRAAEGARGSFRRRCLVCIAGWSAGGLMAIAPGLWASLRAAEGEYAPMIPFDKHGIVVLAVGFVAWLISELAASERRTGRLPQWLLLGFLLVAGLTFYEKNYMLVEREFVRAIVCVDANTGAVRWTAEGLVAPQPPTNRLNTPATPTPLVLGDRVVAWFGSAGALCVDRSGKELWTNRDLPYEGIHGVAASPMPAAGRIIISSGQPKGPYLTALDPQTGERVWTTELDPWGGDEGQHRTPTIAGGDLILQWGWEREEGNDLLWAFDAKTGKLAWKHPAKTHREAVASVVVDGDRLILPSSRQVTALSLTKLASGEQPELWATDMKRKGPYASTPVVVSGLLFTGSNRGHMSCLDAATGELLWSEKLFKGKGIFAAVTAGGGSVLFCDKTGMVSAVATERAFREVAFINLFGEIHASPALVDGRLYIRTESHLWCIEE